MNSKKVDETKMDLIFVWMEASRHWKLTRRVIVCMDSNFHFENIEILHLDFKYIEKEPARTYVLIRSFQVVVCLRGPIKPSIAL